MKVKKWSTVIKNLEKKYPYPKAIVGLKKVYPGKENIEFCITKFEKDKDIGIKIGNTKCYKGMYTPWDKKWKFFEKESGKKIKL